MSADAAAPKGIFLAFSAGDLVDRAPMLKMRLARIADPTARDTVARELRALRQTARRPGGDDIRATGAQRRKHWRKV